MRWHYELVIDGGTDTVKFAGVGLGHCIVLVRDGTAPACGHHFLREIPLHEWPSAQKGSLVCCIIFVSFFRLRVCSWFSEGRQFLSMRLNLDRLVISWSKV